MDNFYLHVTSEGRPQFDAVLGMAFNHAPGSKTEYYAVVEGALVFFWTTPPEKLGMQRKVQLDWDVQEWILKQLDRNTRDVRLPEDLRFYRMVKDQYEFIPCESHRLPFKMDFKAASDFAWNWLQQTDYGEEPDHDGSNGRGWTIFNGDWGHVFHAWQGIIAIRPEWAMYGK